nr:unnamed protein product [Callosobruchus analis]
MNNFKEGSFDSPYKHCLSEIKCVLTNNEDDSFTTPKVTKRMTKTIKKQVKKKPKCRSQKIDTIFRKAQGPINDCDVNPDHMQMAIALSKSTLDQENPEESKHLAAEDSQLTFERSYDQKLGNMLERYGFKSTRSICKSGPVLNHEKGSQRKKYPRFKYSLLSTTKEDRNLLIEKKISAILSQFQTNIDNKMAKSMIFSNLLKSYHVKQSRLVNVQSFDINEDISNYYILNLNLPKSDSSCGCLLKDWKVIPGRELSPSDGDQIPRDLLSENYTNIAFDFETTNSNGSLQISVSSRGNKKVESDQTPSYEIHEENNSPANRNNCSMKEMKENNSFVDIKEIDVGSIGSKQVEVNNESLNCFSTTLDNIGEIKKLYPISHDQQSDISMENSKLTTVSQKYQSFSNKQELSESVNEEENTKSSEPHVYCCSPDLFSSDDDGDDLGNLEKYTKFQASPETNYDQKGIEYFESFSADSCTLSQEMYKSSNVEQHNSISYEMARVSPVNDDQNQSDKVIVISDSDDDSAIVANEENKEKAKTSDDHTEETSSPHKLDTNSCGDSGKCYIKNDLKYFESFSADSCTISQDMNKSSNLEKFKSVSHEMVGAVIVNDDQNEGDKLIVSLDRDEDSAIVANKENKEREKTNHYQTEETCSLHKYDTTNRGIGKHSCNRAELYINYNESFTEIKLNLTALNSKSNQLKGTGKIENPTIQNQELGIKNEYLETKRENSRSPLNCISNNLTTDIELDIPRCSSTSKVYSPSFNSNSKLNVTNYIENMLGEDYITDKDLGVAQNKEISPSQSSSDSIIISDEELNCTKIQCSTPEACCNYNEPNDDDPNNIACGPITNMPIDSKNKVVVQDENRIKQDTAPVTPKNKLFIKTRDVTPMPDYDHMTSAEIVEELKKFRVKPLKRQRGITMLKYIYECTHPMIPTNDKYKDDEEEENRIFKKRRKDNSEGSYNKDNRTEMKCGDVVCKNEITECNPELRKSILLYEPLHLNSVYAMVKEQSNCKFHIEKTGKRLLNSSGKLQIANFLHCIGAVHGKHIRSSDRSTM